MLLSRSPLFVALAVSLAGNAVYAEGGELYIGLSGGGELGWLTYDRDGLSRASGYEGAHPLLFRWGFFLRYGIADDWQLGLGVSNGIRSSVETKGVVIAGRTGHLYARYHDWTLPLSVSYLLTTGHEIACLLTLEGGLTWVSWRDRVFLDPTQVDAEGNLGRLPLERKQMSSMGLYVGFIAELDWRPLEWLAVGVGPYFQMRRTTTVDVVVGLGVRPAVIFGVGPSL